MAILRSCGIGDWKTQSMKKPGKPHKFVGRLTARGPGGAWTFLPIPFSVEGEFGTKSRVSVSGTINGFPFRNSLMPNGDGTHSMTVSRELQAGAGAKAGDAVKVSLQLDQAKRVIELPPELRRALAGAAKAAAALAKPPIGSGRCCQASVRGAHRRLRRMGGRCDPRRDPGPRRQ